MLNWSRWLTVLPSAILAAFLTSFPLHFILYQTLTGSGLVEPYPEFPERVLFPFTAGVAFVWVGAKFAPSSRGRVAKVLLSLWTLLILGAFLLVQYGGGFEGVQLSHQYGAAGPVMAILGGVLGAFIVHRRGS